MSIFFNDTIIYDANEAKKLNPQDLAFIGDAVYSLYVRTKVLNTKSKKTLHEKTKIYVKAKGQSDAIESILPMLTEEELKLYKRARNYKTSSISKNANVADYHRATGFEALIGFLYLINNFKRLNEILKLCMENDYEN